MIGSNPIITAKQTNNKYNNKTIRSDDLIVLEVPSLILSNNMKKYIEIVMFIYIVILSLAVIVSIPLMFIYGCKSINWSYYICVTVFTLYYWYKQFNNK